MSAAVRSWASRSHRSYARTRSTAGQRMSHSTDHRPRSAAAASRAYCGLASDATRSAARIARPRREELGDVRRRREVVDPDRDVRDLVPDLALRPRDDLEDA